MRQTLKAHKRRSKHHVTLRGIRKGLINLARLTDDPRRRAAYVGLARNVNDEITRSHMRDTYRLAEFRAVLESLN